MVGSVDLTVVAIADKLDTTYLASLHWFETS